MMDAPRPARSRPPRIAVIGSTIVDLAMFADRFPREGETLFGRQFDLGWGGKGANQAAAARLCGAAVDMVARVGDDLFGPATIDNFVKRGIGVDHVRVVPGASSGAASVFVEPNGQNRILVVTSANDCLSPADVDEALPVLQHADCIILQLEVPLETVYHAIELAAASRIPCLVNPAPAQRIDLQAIASASYVIPNESEAEALTGFAIRTLGDAEACGHRLLAEGLSRVIITMGARGALLVTRDTVAYVPGVAVDARDTTGAGDAFIGSFAVFLAEGAGPPGSHAEREAIARANLYAALSTTRVGTQKSFVTRQEFDAEWTSRLTAEA